MKVNPIPKEKVVTCISVLYTDTLSSALGEMLLSLVLLLLLLLLCVMLLLLLLLCVLLLRSWSITAGAHDIIVCLIDPQYDKTPKERPVHVDVSSFFLFFLLQYYGGPK